jgi:hypothetical protein
MAASARPDARVPCPLCGGLIHPIAGKCKHCKGDLAALRSARPAAAASLPSLLAGGQVQLAPHANGHSNGHNGHYMLADPTGNFAAPTNGRYVAHVTPAQASAPIALPPNQAMPQQILDGMAPVLPPRPTGRMYAAAPTGHAWWKSWPLLVIIVASFAIVIAAVFMVWPVKDSPDEGAKKLTVPPAPERMDTNPLPPNDPKVAPKITPDPWSGNGGTVTPKKTPDIDIPDDPDDDPAPGKTKISGTGAAMLMIMNHACDRATACGKLDAVLKDYCELNKKQAISPPTNCPSLTKCLEAIDGMSCDNLDDDISTLQSALYKIQTCAAVQGCS